ncbi:glycosyltransferase family 4 protein [Croceibacterium sp. LX-88]|uniref:Glycosyltransferase family 4 protein n=1 Tax=Croceibacterium selenioxidans TaxID=2838833 RepID=A0ABS5W3J7_9SPHN|nr:glycosyltransferase family 4 protein [Croceibacterium selenioxidans]MBT2134056.1 glycosyltransferase family 4 protein [Croceibacterium selenioxidans]
MTGLPIGIVKPTIRLPLGLGERGCRKTGSLDRDPSRARYNLVKTLILSSLAYSLTNFRGALLADMRRNGHKVIAVAPDDNPEVREKLAADGIDFRVIPMQRAGKNPFSDLWLLSNYLWLMIRERPDLVLAYTQKPIVYGGLAARILCIPRFYALMSGLGHVFGSSGQVDTVFRLIVAKLYREAVRWARAIFVFNANDREDMLRLGIISPEQNVIQVPGSGVDIDHFAFAPPPQSQISFILIARLMRDKGIYEFAEAAQRVSADHPKCSFSILGHLDSENPTGLTVADCEKLAQRYPVRFIPGTNDIRPYLSGASVFVLPSYYREGLPRTILEAMAMGRPVITTDMPGCRDPIVQGDNGFLVPPRDSQALAEAMARFVNRPALVEEMGRRSRELAEEVYDVRKVNRLLLNEMDLESPFGYENTARLATARRSSLGAPALAKPQSGKLDRPARAAS